MVSLIPKIFLNKPNFVVNIFVKEMICVIVFTVYIQQ